MKPHPWRASSRDLTLDEVKRAGRAAFGERASMYITDPKQTGGRKYYVYAEFLDGLANRAVDKNGHVIPANRRPEKIWAFGETWLEARRKLEIALNRRLPT